ncbi:MAG: hypothetical protein RSE94_06295 [Pseudomonas sp.]
MNTIEQIVKNESLEDIVSFFALAKAHPHLDMMIRRYNPDAVRHGELERVYMKLFAEGVLAHGEKGLATKGPNWKTPVFVLEKRYI